MLECAGTERVLVLLQLLELATGRIEATGGRSRFLGAS
jgi:hypothetical protein